MNRRELVVGRWKGTVEEMVVVAGRQGVAGRVGKMATKSKDKSNKTKK